MARGGRRQGAGRPGWRRKVEDCTRIEMGQLGKRERLAERVTVTFQHRGQQVSQVMAITHTACGFGGHRAWFVCPTCEGRSSTAFVLGQHLACRSCHGLAYRSQSFGVFAAAFAAMFRHIGKLGPEFTKPKGMHHSTYLRLLTSAHAALAPASLQVDRHMQDVRRQLHELGITEDECQGS